MRNMLRVHSGNSIHDGFTEYEEDIHFDEDDPDFDHHVSAISVPIIITGNEHSLTFLSQTNTNMSLLMPGNMSLASVHPVEVHSSHSSLTTLSHSLDDISSWSSQVEQVMTIEQLRDQMTSCFTCGVSWSDHHVSLDCSECGGYAMERPCPTCEGSCGALWKRDLTMSHASSKARWQGECCSFPPSTTTTNTTKTTASKDPANNTLIAQELCQRLEKLSANS